MTTLKRKQGIIYNYSDSSKRHGLETGRSGSSYSDSQSGEVWRPAAARAVLFIILAMLLLTAGFSARSGRTFRQADDGEPEFGTTGKTEEVAGTQPWTVALVDASGSAYDGQFCGGTLIAPRWVLTAAHCLDDTQAADMDVIVGRHQLSSGQGERIDVVKLILHPEYGEFHDIALVQLAEPATAGQVIGMVTAVNEQLDDAATVAHVSGWGLIPERGEEFSPDKMHGVDIPIVTQAQCRQAYGDYIDSSVVCAGLPQGGADSCNGDSGGPLVVPNDNTWALAGVVSWGDGCGLPGRYGVYTRVESYESWINEYVSNATNPSDDNGGGNDGQETAVAPSDIYDLGAFDGSVEELAIAEVDGELITIHGAELLLEDWSDGDGAYFIGLLIVDGTLLEIHSDVSSEVIIQAATGLLS